MPLSQTTECICLQTHTHTDADTYTYIGTLTVTHTGTLGRLISLHCAVFSTACSVFQFLHFTCYTLPPFLSLSLSLWQSDKRFISLSFCRRQLQMPRKLNMLPFAAPTPFSLLLPALVIFYLLSLDKRRNCSLALRLHFLGTLTGLPAWVCRAIRLLNTHLLAAFIYIFMRHTPSLIGSQPASAWTPSCNLHSNNNN